MSGVRRIAVGAAVTAALACAAFAGSSGARVPGGGSASIRWNDLRYRKELVDQLAPGLTWRLGHSGATRLTVSGTALVGAKGVVFPGECTLNLRFHSWESVELVAYEEDDWRWQPTVHHFGLFPVEVWKEPDPKKAAEELTLQLRGVTGRTRTLRPAAAVTPGARERREITLPPVLTYTPEAQTEIDAAPWLELDLRFGDLVGRAAFEAARFTETRGTTGDTGGSGRTLRFRGLQYAAVRAKSEWVETGSELVVGVMRVESRGAAPEEWLTVVSGGEVPELWRRRIGGTEELRPLEGRRIEVKADRKTTDAVLDGRTLQLRFRGFDYVFDL